MLYKKPLGLHMNLSVGRGQLSMDRAVYQDQYAPMRTEDEAFIHIYDVENVN